MEAMEGDFSFEGAACTVGRKVLFIFKTSHTMRQLLWDGEGGFSLREGSGRVIPGIGKGGASLKEEFGRSSLGVGFRLSGRFSLQYKA